LKRSFPNLWLGDEIQSVFKNSSKKVSFMDRSYYEILFFPDMGLLFAEFADIF